MLRCAVLCCTDDCVSCRATCGHGHLSYTREVAARTNTPAHACLPARLPEGGGIWDIRVVPLTMNENTTASCCIVLWRNSLTHSLTHSILVSPQVHP